MCNRIKILAGVALLCASTALWAEPGPVPPQLPARAWLLIDHDSGMVLARHADEQSVAPASLTKLMTAYLLFEQLKDGKWGLNDRLRISPRAAGMKGARLFLRPGMEVRAEELLTGMIVRSANDATLALVEHVAGNDDSRERALSLR